MSWLRELLFFNDPNLLWVVSGASLLGFTAGLIGCYPYLKRQALIGDVLAHAALPGVTLAFLMFHQKSLMMMVFGAVITSLLAYACINYLVNHTRVKPDSALALVLSVFFAAGLFQLVAIQKMPLASQSGLESFLFGKAAALVGRDVEILILLSTLILLFVLVFQRRLKFISFDRIFCRAHGISVQFYEFMLALAVVLAVATGLQLVGAVLMAALLLTPPASARYWTNNLLSMQILAGIFGALSGLFGALVSFLAPGMPTGPWIVVGCTGLFFISVMFAPQNGLISRYLRQQRLFKRTDDENILRSLYLLANEKFQPGKGFESGLLLNFREISAQRLEASLKRLEKSASLERSGQLLSLTQQGFDIAASITRSHRLWELYLTKFTEIEADHAHGDAEDVEHIIDEDLLKRLLQELGEPQIDPHGKLIPEVK